MNIEWVSCVCARNCFVFTKDLHKILTRKTQWKLMIAYCMSTKCRWNKTESKNISYVVGCDDVWNCFTMPRLTMPRHAIPISTQIERKTNKIIIAYWNRAIVVKGSRALSLAQLCTLSIRLDPIETNSMIQIHVIEIVLGHHTHFLMLFLR